MAIIENGNYSMSKLFDFLYKIIIPKAGGNHYDHVRDCVEQLESLSSELSDDTRIVRANWFFKESSDSTFTQMSKLLADSLSMKGLNDIPYTIVSEQPTGDSMIELVICFATNFSEEVSSRIVSQKENVYCQLKYDDQKWVFTGGSGCFGEVLSTRDSSLNTFQQIKDILKNEKLSFRNLVRQWNYIPEIVGGGFVDNEKKAQNYQEFNDVRADYYSTEGLDQNFPAATGIGVSGGGVCIEFIAIAPGERLKIFSLHNPHQSDAHKYSSSKLIGKNATMTPRFERGKMVFCDGKGHIWVSGTAAIKGEESIEGDVIEQTAVTCDNIELLISQENLIQSGLPDEAYIINPLYIRGYVKSHIDGPLVKAFLVKKYPGALVHVLEADVCRKELLVEVEGEFKIVTDSPSY